MIHIPVEPAVTEYLHVKASRAGIPLNGTFELTPVCNMNCKMCYVRMSKQQQEAVRPLRTAEEWLSLAEEARQAGMLYLLLTGGEPFLHPQFREILTSLHGMGFVISINSNATLIDAETVQWLKRVPPVRINITLYGASNETYARLCGNPQGFTQVMNAIRLLKEAGISVKLNYSVTTYNADDMEDNFAFDQSEKHNVQASTYMFPPLRRDPGSYGRNDRLSPEEAAYYSAKVELLSYGREAFLQRPEGDDCPLSVSTDETCTTEGEKIRCRAGKCSFWITWQGKMLPCGMFPGTDECNVFDSGFEASWKKVRETADEIRLPAQCASCNLRDTCRACAAMVVTESGCFDKVPEYRCQMAHNSRAARAKLKNEIISQGCLNAPDLQGGSYES